MVGHYDAFKDTPWPIFFKEFDEMCPGSKFILVVRNTDSWIKSVVNDFGNYDNEIHKLIYGVAHPSGYEPIWIARYEKHNVEVMDYFKNRPNDFLVLNLSEGRANWEKICAFLGKENPNVEWPHANKINQKKLTLFRNRFLDKLKFFKI